MYLMGSFVLVSCSSNSSSENENTNDSNPTPVEETNFYKGADLSYVNEMEDCGAIYKDANGVQKDPYEIFNEAGTNLARFRLWHNPDWTNYSNLNDVKLAIQRAKDEGFEILLDFHYSDTWTDPEQQQIPHAWIEHINDTETLGQLLYDYTFNTLVELSNENLTPDIVQVGNEINPMILQDGELEWPIDWERNSTLINKGIQAVRDFSNQQNTNVEVMLHIAQPENGLWWFEQATNNGVTDFDWIGLSYYPLWSDFNLNEVGNAFSSLINTYNKRLMVVETAYPFTLENNDTANNILGSDALVNNIPATQQGQLDYMTELSQIIYNSGGEGVIYWEPAWVSTNCSTLWAQGSHWDNAALFDHNGNANIGMQFYSLKFTE
ncbi:glycoside hydrolase family 53 protein [Flavobacteriaceae bacterium 14752]|uniref:glycoside hydrolase family 53 protein n=1 Tax=Mesohalobacter salilacus TaxID=2491711 RepID=UPI000F6360D3|nr:arabinogalactan endo-1,4-beta-galactosidase [Flavobacteriaceae bacterium 14752]